LELLNKAISEFNFTVRKWFKDNDAKANELDCGFKQVLDDFFKKALFNI